MLAGFSGVSNSGDHVAVSFGGKSQRKGSLLQQFARFHKTSRIFLTPTHLPDLIERNKEFKRN